MNAFTDVGESGCMHDKKRIMLQREFAIKYFERYRNKNITKVFLRNRATISLLISSCSRKSGKNWLIKLYLSISQVGCHHIELDKYKGDSRFC